MRQRLLLIALTVLFTTAASAQTMPVPSPPSIGAPSYALMDFESGNLIIDRDPDEPREPASLVKLMTAYVVFSELEQGHLSLDEEVPISERAWRMRGSRMFVEVGSSVSVNDLLRGMIIQSGNDASVALAEHVAGNEETFAQFMNDHARELGMENTHFANSTGWPDPDQTTTARDIAKLARTMIRDFPEFYQFYSEREFTYADITQQNRNSLLWRDDSVDGLKTGHTSGAGYNLVSSAERDGMRLISVVLGTDSANARMQQSQSLLNYGFRFFRTYELYAAETALTEPKLWKGARDTIPLGVREPLRVTIPEREYDNMEASMRVPSTIVAPVRAGEEFGEVRVRVGEDIIAEVPLVALEDGDEGGFFGRLVDEVMLLFR